MLKRILIFFLIACLTVCGCTPNVNRKEEKITFSGLDDKKLQEYVAENLYSGINAEFSNEDYKIEQITTVYVSKEYIEELEYNSKSNIYFGYTENDLSKLFDGKKYVFNVGKDNQTIVEEFKFYNDNYNKIIKNVMVGSGVILVCATVSIASGGTIGIIFAASAKTAATFATSSAALSGLMSYAIEYYETGDLNTALEKAEIVMKYIDDIELELVNNKYKVKLTNFRSTFYKDFKSLFDKGYIDWKRKIVHSFNGFCVDGKVRYSEYLPAKEVYRHLMRLNECYEVNFYKGYLQKKTEELKMLPLHKGDVVVRIFPTEKNDDSKEILGMGMFVTKDSPNDIKVDIPDLFECIPDIED